MCHDVVCFIISVQYRYDHDISPLDQFPDKNASQSGRKIAPKTPANFFKNGPTHSQYQRPRGISSS